MDVESASGPRLLQWQDDFYGSLRHKGRSDNTLKNYRTDLQCFNQFMLKHRKELELSEFSAQDVESFGQYLNDRYSSDNSKRRRIQTVRLFFDYLVSKDLFPNNPVRKMPAGPKFLDIPRPGQFSEIKTLWSYLLEQEYKDNALQSLIGLRNQLIFLLIYGGGLKVSDLSKLKVEHIMTGKNPRVLIIPRKRDPYSVPLPAPFGDILKEYLMALESEKERAGLEFDDLFFNANPYRILSGGLSARGLEVIFKDISKALMMKVTPKSVRQACIFCWIHEDHRPGLIKEWMGVAPSYNLKNYVALKDKIYFQKDFLVPLRDEMRRKKMKQ